ncbi:B3 domain-containing protein At4g34400-like [Helianthus annuus]|uniref:B3 domain-containing protein At4g34400-like n=1 Tax=Helianthus annuus TaxID=4232 RepID=UPI000B909B45|nr:B3 domain-containing protein At4g34400-like [Helianthus annuus]
MNSSCVTVLDEDSSLKLVIPEAYVIKCYSYTPVNDYYNIFAAGQIWKVKTEKINDNYVFTKGCPKLFHDLAIEDDDILLLMKMDSNTFELKIYGRGVEVVLTNKDESEDESLLEIPKDTYYKNVQFINEGSKKEEVNKNIAGKEKSKEETKISLREETNQPTNDDVKKKGKQVEAYCHAEDSKELICGTYVEIPNVSTVGERTRNRLVNEKRKRNDHALKILDVERKVVARKNTVEESGKYEFTTKGENRMRMLANVVRFAGFRNKVHELNVTNMNGKTIDMNLRRQKNGDGVRYAIEGWPMFMKENGLRLGDTMHFTYISSGNLLILSQVDGVNAG